MMIIIIIIIKYSKIDLKCKKVFDGKYAQRKLSQGYPVYMIKVWSELVTKFIS
jgi:hypothetical protein